MCPSVGMRAQGKHIDGRIQLRRAGATLHTNSLISVQKCELFCWEFSVGIIFLDLLFSSCSPCGERNFSSGPMYLSNLIQNMAWSFR